MVDARGAAFCVELFAPRKNDDDGDCCNAQKMMATK
jgi:hypothetical protein